MILSLFSSVLLKAQISQGKILVGVSSMVPLLSTGNNFLSIGYSTIKQKSNAAGFTEPDPSKYLNLYLNPKVGYFITNNIALGLDIFTMYTNSKDGDYSYNNLLLSGGPFVRYYVSSGTILPFLEAGGTIGTVKSKSDFGAYFGESKSTTNIFSFGGGVGIAVPLGNRVTFDFLLGYNSLTIKEKDDNPDNERDIYGTFGFNFGFVIMLGSDE